jgi:GntR family transcriptional regulator
MIYALGPKAQRVYDAILGRITSGQLAPGDKLPSHVDLAGQFGVAPLTVRQVLARLEGEGLVAREQGRGTFVRSATRPAVLVVGADESTRALLLASIERSGRASLVADSPGEALDLLNDEQKIAFILADVRMPGIHDGTEFISTVRRRWPDIPLAVLTGHTDDLAGLHGTPQWPILVLSKPVWPQQIDETLSLVLCSQSLAASVS